MICKNISPDHYQTPSLSEGLGLEVPEGVLVVQVIRGGPAHQAGLRGGNREVVIRGIRLRLGGDIITDIDGIAINGMKQLVQHVEQMKVGHAADLGILRKGFTTRIRVLLTERP